MTIQSDVSQDELVQLLRWLSPKQCQNHRMTRIGLNGDGGYVLPDDLDGVDAALSIGVGPDVSFDIHLAKYGIHSYQFDHTVEKAPSDHALCHFHKIGWGAQTGGEFMSLADMMASCKLTLSHDLLLKFDVEGAEWNTLQACSAAQFAPYRLIVAELHNLDRLLEREYFNVYKACLTKLFERHTCVHLHANNWAGVSLMHNMAVPSVLEISLLRNDRDTFLPYTGPLPTALDVPNHPYRPDIILRPY